MKTLCEFMVGFLHPKKAFDKLKDLLLFLVHFIFPYYSRGYRSWLHKSIDLASGKLEKTILQIFYNFE